MAAVDFIPKFYHFVYKQYSLFLFKKDLLAGITVSIVALPMAMAFAMACGAKPEQGLYTAIVLGFFLSLLGGSRVQVGGPTGAFIVLLSDVIQKTGYAGLCISTVIGALFLIAWGLLRLGSWIRFVSQPLVFGFTAGVAFLIFSLQIKDFLGLKVASLPHEVVAKWLTYFGAIGTYQPATLWVGVGTFLLMFFFRRFVPSIPWGIVGIGFATLAATLFSLPLETIASRFGPFPQSLGIISFPSLASHVSWQELILNGLAIGFIAGLESLLAAVVADQMIGGKHRPNCELIGVGIANLAAIAFGGIPGTGGLARTTASVKMGAQTPVAGIVHSVFLLLVLYLFAPFVSQIPLVALSAVLIMISWSMLQTSQLFRFFKLSVEDRAIFLTVFCLTLFVNIIAAVFLGVALASILFMSKMSRSAKAVKREESGSTHVYDFRGPLFFGSVHLLKEFPLVEQETLVFHLEGVSHLDTSGVQGLRELKNRCKKQKKIFLLSGIGKEYLDKFSSWDPAVFRRPADASDRYSPPDQSPKHSTPNP